MHYEKTPENHQQSNQQKSFFSKKLEDSKKIFCIHCNNASVDAFKSRLHDAMEGRMLGKATYKRKETSTNAKRHL